MTKRKIEENAYSELWKYITKYQEMNFWLFYWIEKLVLNSWLNDRKISATLMSKLAINDLLDIYKSLVADIYWIESEDYEIIKKLLNFIKNKIISYRNDIIHGFLFVDEEDLGTLKILREKTKSKWLINEDFNWNTEVLKEQIKLLIHVNFLLHSIWKNIECNKKIEWSVKVNGKIILINFKGIIKLLNSLYK